MIAKIKHSIGNVHVEVPLEVNSRFNTWIKLNTAWKRKVKIYEIKVEYRPPDSDYFILCFEKRWKEVFKSCERLGREPDIEMLVFFTKFFPDKIKYHSKLPNNPFRENSILDIIDRLFVEIRHAMQFCFKKCEKELKEELRKLLRKYALFGISITAHELCIAKCLEQHKYLI